MKKTFYTQQQKEVLETEFTKETSKVKPLTEATGLMILDTLGEQQNALQNIEAILQRIEQATLLDKQNQ